MADSKQLYQEVILDHNRKPRNWGVLPDATHKAEGHNPLCGDHIVLTLKMDGDTVDAVNFQGESCAICKASSSMMTTTVKGKSRSGAEQLVREFRDMATGQLNVDSPHHLGRLTVFSGVRDLPTRVKCAILPWHTLHAALNSEASVTTEADADPMHAPVGNA
ncbi:MAG: SUF system NifU family Fe-S cluster assembly protein [Betaproteobacteria bacterium RIFCSPLOWO2_02_FULL_67_26]|nr:MAG: SUF system NifU family Fe-S cluster assembly protein [Betaproteobacteria bacterium RIFCSPLOWO2_02_FULL_67_26]